MHCNKGLMAAFLGCAVLLVSLFSLSAYAADESLPAPPTGFRWHEAKNNVGSFLVPDGWHVKEEAQNGTDALFISREDIDTTGGFVVGFSVNKIINLPRASGPASKFARVYVQKLIQDNEVLKSGAVNGNSVPMNVVRVKGNNHGIATIVHYIAIGDDARNRVFLIIFEAPEREWEEESKKGEPMLNLFGLGD